MTVALALPATWLDDDTRALILALESRLQSFQPTNIVKSTYYEAKQFLKDLGIAIPPMLRSMSCAIGWPATVVDVLEERLDLTGWALPGVDDFGLGEVFDANQLDVEASWAHLDALIYGCSFVAVSTGYEDEPDPLITMESPTVMTAITSPRSRRVEAALAVEEDDNGIVTGADLWLPETTLHLTRGTGWDIAERDDHGLGRVPIVQLINRPRSGNMYGRSEITPAVQYLTDCAMRTLAASEVGREFFASPQRYVLGAPESFFMREVTKDDGTTELEERPAWESYLGRILAIERDESDQIPTVGEFRGASLGPYFDQIKMLAQLLAAESSIPAHYLGFVVDNPTSADAIRQGEARLIKRVEKRQRQFGRNWAEVAELALLVRDGLVPDGFAEMAPEWTNAATPTKAADADRIQKLIAAKVLRPDSPVTWAELGFTPEQQRALAEEEPVAEPAAVPPAAGPPIVLPAAGAAGTTE